MLKISYDGELIKTNSYQSMNEPVEEMENETKKTS